MKNYHTVSSGRFVLWLLALALLPFTMITSANAQDSANVQIIHNSADAAAAEVDIYIGADAEEARAADPISLDFRQATPFVSVPAGVELTIEIYGRDATPDGNAAFAVSGVEFSEDGTYRVIANGIIGAGGDEEFALYVEGDAKTEADDAEGVEFYVWHGATDAPGVDIWARGVGRLIEDLEYAQITDYLAVGAADYAIDITVAGETDVVASFIAPLEGAAGAAVGVLASGFLAPAEGEPAFGLLAVFADGATVMLPEAAPTANLPHQALDLVAGETELRVTGVTGLAGDLVVITTTPDDGDFLGESIVGLTALTENVFNASVLVDVDGASPVDHTAHIVRGASAESADQGIVSQETLENVLAISDPAAIYAMTQLVWSGETATGFAESVTIDVVEVLYDGTVGPGYYTFDLHEFSDGMIGAFVGISQLDLEVNQEHTDVVVDFVEPVSPADDNPRRVDDIVVETADFFAMLHLGPAGTDAAGERIPAQTPALLTSTPEAFRPLGVVGTVAILEAAFVQIIHNSADAAAAEVDIYIGADAEDARAADPISLDFREATPLLPVPAGVGLTVEIYGRDATPDGNAVFAASGVEFSEEGIYRVIANGLFYDHSHDNEMSVAGGHREFGLFIEDMGKFEADEEDEVEFYVWHGATDAPAVDIWARGVGTLIEELDYAEITDYLAVPADNYVIDITLPGETDVVASFYAPLEEAGGVAIGVLASGFLTPGEGDPAFGLLAVFVDGTTIMLPETADPMVQIIHNAADPAAASVDIYANGDLLLEAFGFREATAYLELPGRTGLDLEIFPAGADTETTEPVFSVDGVEFEYNGVFSVIANGLLHAEDDHSHVAGGHMGPYTGFGLYIVDVAAMSAPEGEVSFYIWHGATDAPDVDVWVHDGPALALDLGYGEHTELITVPAALYPVLLGAEGSAGDLDEALVQFDADLSIADGLGLAILASGFLEPADDEAAFGLLVALPDGTTLVLDPDTPTSSEVVQADVPGDFRLNQNYPNPFNPSTNIQFQLPESTNVTLEVFNVQGQRVATLVDGTRQAGSHTVTFDASQLSSGIYLYRLQAGSFSQVNKMMLIK